MCVGVCVFDITYSPHPPLYPLGVHSPIIWLVGGPRLHVSRLFPILTRGSIHPLYHGGHCVCVCVFDIACSSHPSLHLPDAHSPFIYLVGGPRSHVSILLPIIVRGSIHPVYHEGHCVCVCVCVCLTLPVPPTPHLIFKIAFNHCPRLNPPCVSRGTLCVCGCVCLPLHAPPTPHCVLPMFIAH